MTYIQTDSTGRIVAATEKKEYADDTYFEFDLPEGFDLAKIGDYIIRDGELVESPREPTPEEIEEIKRAERAAQMDTVISLFVKTAEITDAQALTVSAFYDEWRATDENGKPIHYEVGERRNYQGHLYRCNLAHDSQDSWNPADAHSLWTRIIPEGEIPEWEQPQPGIFDGYEKGQKVTHNGKLYESTFDGLNVWEPGTVGADIWREVEA